MRLSRLGKLDRQRYLMLRQLEVIGATVCHGVTEYEIGSSEGSCQMGWREGEPRRRVVRAYSHCGDDEEALSWRR